MTAPQSLFLASGNPHKVRELQELSDQAGLRLRFHSAKEIGGMPDVVEDTGTFEGNARKKAHALRALVPPHAWVLADDSGICVDALEGGPGVESAYFAGPENDDDANLTKLIEVMRSVPTAQRGAHYVCVLYLIAKHGGEHVFEGKCHGQLAVKPTGKGGFGYDPLFVPDGFTDTFGVLPATTKQELSHRGAAWQKLARWMANKLDEET
ncbi:MAG: RdgB/HAM1 family non-canonical purine NTP pyrophosphatase [Opitutaceae bacterium]|jgi:XTP/dITP diphosphohydrolase|nr:RdgB/HAM1 family non-canonical purine NTP pyrophosphatase [Opitutaceae bacterium]